MILGAALAFVALFSLVSILVGGEEPRRGADPREGYWIRYGVH